MKDSGFVLSECGLDPGQEQILVGAGLAEDTNQGKPGHSPVWFVSNDVFARIALWHEEGHKIPFQQVIDELKVNAKFEAWPPKFVHAQLETNEWNKDAAALTLYFEGQPTAEDIIDVLKKRDPEFPLWAYPDDPQFTFEFSQTRVSDLAGLTRLQCHPTT